MDRAVIVSGGGTGIGRAVARRFAADGDRVLLVGRRAEVLREAAETIAADADADAGAGGAGEVRTLAADLTDPEDARRVREEAVARFGRVDVLVNNAGGNVEYAASGADAPSGLDGVAWQWRSNFESNVLTAVLLTEALADLLQEPGRRVVLLSSIAAYRGSGTGSYAAAKAALHPYVYDMAGRLGPHGATVNAVAPGYIEATGFFGDRMTEQRRGQLAAQTVNGRVGTPEDVADVVHWLCSPGAGHVTGQIVQVNGGARYGS
ncbi:SDR family NAD(P)-dependent oxidoreductase [Streptomyces nanshensis]|uniref:Oxidoreductase n=1 Tax=Streptomyces nanshensis TaxID=518642 RepID=A0A1E7L672_9ACTN|nr:SDR family oxidoreductase [Streptomyces nanshensis]OEV11707.1 oxidoreductase [Streptomyces nanshensis]